MIGWEVAWRALQTITDQIEAFEKLATTTCTLPLVGALNNRLTELQERLSFGSPRTDA